MTWLSYDIDVVFRCIFALLIAVDLVGNSIVCWVVKRFNFMRTPMNYLLVNLAISDIMLGVFVAPRNLFYGLYEHPVGITGDLLCKFLTYGNMSWIGSCVGVYTLLAIAWERYNAIMKPHLSRFSVRQIKIAIALSWVFGIVMTAYETAVLEYSTKINSCEYNWNLKLGAVIDSSVWLVVVALFPSLAMAVLYGGVVKILWFSKNKISDVSQRALQKSRKRVTKSVITVTLILFVCWTPNLSYYFATSCRPKNSSTAESIHSIAPVLYQVSRVLILVNSAVNPFVYHIQDARFRRCMNRIIAFTCSKRRVEIPPTQTAEVTRHPPRRILRPLT